ncbi:MAG: SAM-dependent methyltransferase [Planctomycetaceae bacterium]|nr:SAM-dependent methyltransferase [Planctomycetaceae bacterium]
MFSPDQYSLLDFGAGRRLERFGSLVLDRPCPAVEGMPCAAPQRWADADARFGDRGSGEECWSQNGDLSDRWTIDHGPLRFELKRTEFGHLGLFPEQAGNWDWIARQVKDHGPGMRVLNLFAYTGGCTLAAAAAGAEIVHVDAARNTVNWARRNAELSGLAQAPIRWIADDAAKFVRREVKRGNRYDAVVLDPPSYGHGARGEVWRLSKHLMPLLKNCARLTSGRRRFILLTCHTPGYGAERLGEMLAQACDDQSGHISAGPLAIRSVDGRDMPSGVFACWSAR